MKDERPRVRRARIFLKVLAFATAGSLLLSFGSFATASEIRVQMSGTGDGASGSLTVRSGMVDLASIMKVFNLRSSLDLMGDRLDLVGDSGSCRLLVGSPLVLSRGLFTVLSGPVQSLGGKFVIPHDFLTKALPGLTGRSFDLDDDGSTLVVGPGNTGGFSGQRPEELGRFASFIRRDQYVPEEILREEPKGLSVVVLDPGHGGRSLGAQGSTGTLEKTLVLSVAEKLKTRLEEELDLKVVLTRTADYFVGLKERTAIANNNGAELFLSIHANATFRKEIEGFETYYLSFKSSDKKAVKYAEIENQALGVKGGADEEALLEAILWDMAQTSFINESREVASIIQRSLVHDLRGSDRGVRQAPLAVLMGARMPAVLVEIGFISNPEQELRLNRESHQEEIARSLYRAIETYHRKLLRGEIQRSRP